MHQKSPTQLRRELAASLAQRKTYEELRRTLEALRSTPADWSAGDPPANRVRNSTLDMELERLDDSIREMAIDAASIRTALIVDHEVDPAEVCPAR